MQRGGPDQSGGCGVAGHPRSTYLKMGKWEFAVADFDAALRLAPTMASALYGRGVARLKGGDDAAGKADQAAAIAIEPKIAEEFVRYGVQ